MNTITRSQWGAKPPKTPQKKIVGSVSYVIIHHTGGSLCCAGKPCPEIVRNIQHHHMKDKNYDDIGFNWLVAQTGQIFEGRGWGVAGAAAEDFNAKAVSISLIGDFNYESPQKVQLEAVHRLIRSGVENGKIDSSYKLLGHNQVKSTPTDCPGTKLRELIREWPHFSLKP
uniref:Peptidoglycan-recognition protein n=1 Tax=Cuerna arida TaxID=1464854 RepID=A0A1B6F137_9HEMI